MHLRRYSCHPPFCQVWLQLNKFLQIGNFYCLLLKSEEDAFNGESSLLHANNSYTQKANHVNVLFSTVNLQCTLLCKKVNEPSAKGSMPVSKAMEAVRNEMITCKLGNSIYLHGHCSKIKRISINGKPVMDLLTTKANTIYYASKVIT